MFARASTLLLVILCFASVRAEAQSVFIEELTWPELDLFVRQGKRIALVPIGGTEQSGPHIVLGKHNVRVKALAGRIATALGDALVAPVVAYVPEGDVDPATSHMRFPGTLTVPAKTFESVLEYAARSLRSAGFTTIVLLGDHGGYQRNEQNVASRLTREWKGATRVVALVEYYNVTGTRYKQALVERGFSEREIGTHAGLADTSLALAVDPRLVRAQQLTQPATLDALHGVQGDPRRASAELGNLGVDAIVSESVAAIRRAAAKP